MLAASFNPSPNVYPLTFSVGDYDGDKGLAIWQPEIVSCFQPPDLSYSVEPESVAKCFSAKNEKVDDFFDRVERLEFHQTIQELQWFLLGAIRENSVVGRYSEFHELATYKLGYTHPETIRLAYMLVMWYLLRDRVLITSQVL